MTKIQKFLAHVFVCIAISGSLLTPEIASASLPTAEVDRLREVFASIEETTDDLRDALDRFFSDRQRKNLSEDLLELNGEVMEIFASLETSVRSRATAVEFNDLVAEFFRMNQIEVSSSYVEWPFAGFDIDGANHLDEGSKSVIAANQALNKTRIRLLKKYGISDNGGDMREDNVQ